MSSSIVKKSYHEIPLMRKGTATPTGINQSDKGFHYGPRRTSMQENLSAGFKPFFEQQRRRPAYTFEQSDQRLYYSLIGKNHI